MSDFKAKLLQNQAYLADNANIEEVLPHLYSGMILSAEEYESVKKTQALKGMTAAANQLVPILCEKDYASFHKFLSILKDTNQSQIAKVLEETTVPWSPENFLSSRDKEAIAKNKDALVKEIKIKTILKTLESNREFWTTDEKHKISSISQLTKKTEALLDLVCAGTYSQLAVLREALTKEGQQDICEKLPTVSQEQINPAPLIVPVNIEVEIQTGSDDAAPFSETAVKDLMKQLVAKLNDNSSDVHKKLKGDYDLAGIKAEIPSKHRDGRFSLEITPRSPALEKKINEDVTSNHMGKIIKQYSRIADQRRPWELCTKMYTPGAAGNDGIPTATKAASIPHSGSMGEKTKVFKKLLYDMLDKKEYTQFEIFHLLKQHRGKSYHTVMDLADDEQVPLTHLCVEKGRLNILHVILYMGWWNFTHKRKIPQSSTSLYRGMDCKQIADAKRSRKAMDEVRMLTDWEESLSSVMKAARSGDREKLKRLMEAEGESLHYRDLNNANALYWAIVSDDEETFELLLKKGGLDPTMQTRKKETLLHVACQLGMSRFIPILIKAGIDAYKEDTGKKSPFDKIAENGDVESLKQFVKCNKKPKENFISLAAFHGRKRLVEYVLNERLLAVDAYDQYHRTAIMRAVEGSHADIVKTLLSKGASLECQATTGRNLLHFVAESGCKDCFTVLKPELQKKGFFESYLITKDRYNGVELCFLIRGRDKGRDAWHYVEIARHRVPLFLKKTKSGNVDVAAFGKVVKSGWGVNPEQEVVDEIETLFRKRRQNESAERDMTPLHIAIFKGNTEVAMEFVKSGADVHITDKFGLTPLMIAAAKDNLDLIQALEAKGARFNDLSNDGLDAEKIAQQNENTSVINYIGGRDHYRLAANFLNSDVTKLQKELGETRLNELRSQGRDVKRHIIDTLRDFRIDINESLLSLGSGPILEASEDQPSNR